MEYNESVFREACKDFFDKIKVSDELKESVLDANGKNKVVNVRCISKAMMTSAAVVICVLLLGGGAVYAFTNTAIRSFFFPYSGGEFEEVYTETDREYVIGDHLIQLDGMIYDEAMKVGYLSFHFLKSDGTPEESQPYIVSLCDSLGDSMLTRHVSTCHMCVGEDDVYLVTTYLNSSIVTSDGANVFLKFFDEDVEKTNGCRVRYTVLDKENWKKLKEEIGALNSEELIQLDLSGFSESGVAKALFDNDLVQPEVLDILENYGLEEIDYKKTPVQTIETEKCKVIVGRTDVLLDFNKADDIGRLSLRRADGTETVLIENNEVKWDGHYGVGSISDNGASVYRFEFGYVLGQDEKISVILDGKVYE